MSQPTLFDNAKKEQPKEQAKRAKHSLVLSDGGISFNDGEETVTAKLPDPPKPVDYGFVDGDSVEARKKNNEIALEIIRNNEKLTKEQRELVHRNFSGIGGLIKATEEQRKELGYTASNILAEGQYLTPWWVCKLIAGLIPYPSAGESKISVLDPTCGSGSLLYYLDPERFNVYGIEKEETAYTVAKALFPDGQIIKDDVLYHIAGLEGRFNVVVTNPPYGLSWQVDGETMLERAGWQGKIKSHLATLEISIRAMANSGLIFAVLPQGCLENEELITFRRWVRNHCEEVAIIDLSKQTFKSSGTVQKTFVWVLLYNNSYSPYYGRALDTLHLNASSPDDVQAVISSLRYSDWWRRIEAVTNTKVSEFKLTPFNPNPELPTQVFDKTLPMTGIDVVGVHLGKHKLVVKPNGLVAALKLQELIQVHCGREYNYSTKQYDNRFDELVRLSNFYTSDMPLEEYELFKLLKAMNLKYSIHPQVHNWLKKKRKLHRRMMTPFELLNDESQVYEIEYEERGVVKTKRLLGEDMVVTERGPVKVIDLKEDDEITSFTYSEDV